MTKTISLNDYAYSEVAVLAGKLSILAKKPVSLGMTIQLATGIFGKILENPETKKSVGEAFSEIFDKMLTPEEFELSWDKFYEMITGEKREQ